MRNLIPIILIFCSFCSYAQNGITFKIEELSKPENLLRLKSHDDIYKDLILSEVSLSKGDINRNNILFNYNIIAKSEAPDSLVNFNANSFFYGMYEAYATHRPFVLSPDMIWLLISQGFARHINADPEAMRSYFVDFSDKMTLIVNVKESLDSPNISWEKVISQFTKQIGKNVGDDITKLLSCEFSTTTSIEETASQITIMESMKPYFQFVVIRIICGIPEITLQGTPDDWQKVLDKTRLLKRYELDWWISDLEPILEEFIKASNGNIDTEFWMDMFKYHTLEQYGAPDIIDGWIVKFFPYDKNGKRNNLQELRGGNNLPEEIVKVDFKFIDTSNDTIVEIPMEIWAGFIGLEQNNKNFALTPKIGWMIKKKDIENIGLKTKLEIESQSNSSTISIRVKEFPAILLELSAIKTLDITFIGSINIPPELAKVRIENLHLSGDITEQESEKIKQLFPDSKIRINGKTL